MVGYYLKLARSGYEEKAALVIRSEYDPARIAVESTMEIFEGEVEELTFWPIKLSVV
jgi:hypothetical protein